MLVTADWLVPVVGEPIRDAGVFVHGGRIAEVGRAQDLVRNHPRAQRYHHEDCVITPGLVNAHIHLSLTALAGMLPPQPFPEWLAKVARATNALDADDFAASTASGALDCLRHGVTVVGDVSYGPEALAAAADAGLGGAFYWEVLGITPSSLAEELAAREFPVDEPHCGLRTRCALSAHTVYTSGPALVRELHRIARDIGVGFMMHAAESEAEIELLVTNSGPLAPLAQRLATGFVPPRVGAIRYLSRLGALDDTVLVHCVRIQSGEFEMLDRAAGVVLCPRSNRYLRNGSPPAERIIRSGATVALGTDSAASNDDLDLRAEARAVRELVPDISPKTLLRMMTSDGAKVLGLEPIFGQLAQGSQADLAVFATGPTDTPEAAVVESVGAETVRAVMSNGNWRVLDGRAAVGTRGVSEATERAARKARTALDIPQ